MKTCSVCKNTKELVLFYTKSNGAPRAECKACTNADNSKRQKANKTQRNIYKAEWLRKTGGKAQKKWRANNPGKVNAKTAQRQAVKLQRTPKWLKPLDFTHIKMFYIAAKSLTSELGIEFEVDHIIPLQGELISGLHVPSNLQVITASDNARKYNKYENR